MCLTVNMLCWSCSGWFSTRNFWEIKTSFPAFWRNVLHHFVVLTTDKMAPGSLSSRLSSSVLVLLAVCHRSVYLTRRPHFSAHLWSPTLLNVLKIFTEGLISETESSWRPAAFQRPSNSLHIFDLFGLCELWTWIHLWWKCFYLFKGKKRNSAITQNIMQ